MTRKDYQLITDTISAMDIKLGEANQQYVANLFAFALSRENPRFDADRFVKACKA